MELQDLISHYVAQIVALSQEGRTAANAAQIAVVSATIAQLSRLQALQDTIASNEARLGGNR